MPKFDPEGTGYDVGALKKVLKRFRKDPKTGHGPSILPIRPGLGRILKGAKHPTFNLTEQEERKRGNTIIKFGGSRFSVNLHRLKKGRSLGFNLSDSPTRK